MQPADNPRFRSPLTPPKQTADMYLGSPECKALFASFDSTGGPIVPIIVRPSKNGKYEILEGWTRWQWALKKSKSRRKDIKLRCMIYTGSNNEDTYKTILNVARRGYSPLIEAGLFARIVADNGGNISAAAKRVGVTRPTMQNRLRLLKLPVEMQRLIENGAINQTAGETIFHTLTGGTDYLRQQERDKSLNADERQRAHRFEKGLDYIASHVGKLREEDPSASIKNTAIVELWSEFMRDSVTKRIKKAKKKVAKKGAARDDLHATDDIAIATVSTDGAIDAMTLLGKEIACNSLLANSKTENPHFQKANLEARSGMLAIAYTQGWACPPMLTELMVNEDTGDPLYNDETLATMNEDVIRDFTLRGYLKWQREDNNLVLPEKSSLHDHAEWQAFYRRNFSIKQLCTELQAVLVDMTEAKKTREHTKRLPKVDLEEMESELDDIPV